MTKSGPDQPHGLRELSRAQYDRIAGWRQRITASWQRHVAAAVETGRLLIEAHDDLISIHGAWAHLVETGLPFNRAKAHKLMAIARHPTLANVSNWKHLPADNWTVLYQLSLITDDVLQTLIDTNEVSARTQHSDVARLRHTTAAGRGVAVLAHKDTMTLANQRMQAEANRYINTIWDQAKAGLLTDEELTGVFKTFLAVNELFGASAELMSTKWYSEPMKTVNEPMWSNGNEPDHATHGATAQRNKSTDSEDT
jgi:hypothetical protein